MSRSFAASARANLHHLWHGFQLQEDGGWRCAKCFEKPLPALDACSGMPATSSDHWLSLPHLRWLAPSPGFKERGEDDTNPSKSHPRSRNGSASSHDTEERSQYK